MGLAGRIAMGASVLVIGGLVVLAAPVLGTVSGIVSSVGQSPEVESTQATDAGATSTPETPDADASDADPLADHIYVGGGTWIPKGDPAGCEAPRWLSIGRMKASLNDDLIDRGARTFAMGTVGLDDDGRIVTYTVAVGDTLYGIGERFCVANALSYSMLNHTRMIQPDEVLLLHPDSSIPWIPSFSPPDAPEGFLQIPYEEAVAAMKVAADAGDVDAMRAIFADGLSAMFPIRADADVIQQALDAGDLTALRQMFA